LSGAGVFNQTDIDEFAKRYFGDQSQDLLYAVLKPLVSRFEELQEDEQNEFSRQADRLRTTLRILVSVLTFADLELENFTSLARFLRRYLPKPPTELPREIQEQSTSSHSAFRKQVAASSLCRVALAFFDPMQEKTPAERRMSM